jgi:hypothetical protein
MSEFITLTGAELDAVSGGLGPAVEATLSFSGLESAVGVSAALSFLVSASGPTSVTLSATGPTLTATTIGGMPASIGLTLTASSS